MLSQPTKATSLGTESGLRWVDEQQKGATVMNLSGNLGPSPRSLEVEDLESFDRLLAAGAVHLQGWHAQSLDLRDRSSALAGLDVEGAIFLGCTFDEGMEDALRRRGALIFPRLTGVPFKPYRSTLYSPDELYEGLAGAPYESCPTRGSTNGASSQASGTGWTPPSPPRCTTMPSAMRWTS
jgi:hypothetical protein